MDITCINDVYASIDSIYASYLTAISLGNTNVENWNKEILLQVSMLVNLIKVAGLDADLSAVTTYCAELKTLLNYTP